MRMLKILFWTCQSKCHLDLKERIAANNQRLMSELAWSIVESPQVFYTQGDYLLNQQRIQEKAGFMLETWLNRGGIHLASAR